jgi:hypothetical protein
LDKGLPPIPLEESQEGGRDREHPNGIPQYVLRTMA